MTMRTRRNIVLSLAALPAVLVACQAPAPTPAPPAPVAVGATKLFLMVDLVQGSKNIPTELRASRSCQLNNRFPRNSEMVWRIRVHDPKTGDPMDDKMLKGVAIKLATGKSADAKFGPHPKDPPNELFWTGSYVVPKDHATGTLKYSVEATAIDGRVGMFEPFPTVVSLPTILEETLADAPPTPAKA
ncbi:MAG: hypothetical protein EPO26_04860 [Chloroflexota bacterium]|nr:MAG: hypothetical protein EPO26_04860 [Chloroflexota bacterium]